MGQCFSHQGGSAKKYAVDGGDSAEQVPEQKKQDAKPAAAPAKPTSGAINNYAGPKPKLDPKDFIFKDLKGEKRVKAPGSVDGQAFTIMNCEDCDLYILDHCAQIQIDDCKNCRIFIGPTDGSVFIRDCSDLKCAVIARQFRTRDVTKSEIMLHVRTRPIIESSTDISMGCYNLNFEKLPELMKSAKLDVLHNNWSWIYDFTPKPNNWKYMEEDASVETLLSPIPEEAKAAMGKHGEEGPFIRLWGDRPQAAPDYMFVIFPAHKQDGAMQFINQAKHQAVVLRTNKAEVSPEIASQMAHSAGWARAVERDLSGGQCVGVELSGAGVRAKLHSVAHVLGGAETEQQDVGTMFRTLGIENS